MSLLLAWLLTAFAAPPLPYTIGADGLPVVSEDLSAPFPVDPTVVQGTLPNGLRWYVEQNPRPAQRAELRLVLLAGSIVEEENQRGLAHFVEHMAFNGTKKYPENDVIRVMEGHGARFGAHVNATTSFDTTIYQLQVPSEDPKAVDTALDIFAQQVSALSFDPDECAREIGVVTEEWRLDQGVGERLRAATLPAIFHGSRYLDRLPIGTADSVKSFDCAEARRFWQTWYRPDLMAVMVVGDVNVARVTKTIRKAFGKIPGPATPTARPYYTVPDHDQPVVAIVADRELTGTSLSILDKVDDVEENRQGAYREMFVEQMAWSALNERLGILALDPASPFVAAGASPGALGHQRAAQDLSASVKEGRWKEALDVLLTEAERARRYGFSEAEVERGRQNAWIGMQQYYDEQESTDSEEHIEELVRVYTTGEPMPGVPYEYALAKRWLPTITAEEVSAWAKGALFTGKSRVVMLAMPEKAGLVVPTEAELLGAIDAVAKKEIAPPAGEEAVGPLMTEELSPGKVQEVGRDAALGTVTWKLGNGATVILKPTTFLQDQVLFRGFGPGGASVFDDSSGMYVPAITAANIVERSGVGPHDAVALAKLLAGADVAVRPYIGDYFDAINGGAKKRDLETMFQLIWLTATQPRFDASAFQAERAEREEELRNRAQNPDAAFWDAYSDLIWQKNPRYTSWKSSDLDDMDLEKSKAAWAARFADFSDWTFVFTGSFAPDDLQPLVARYLATLPGGGKAEAWVDDGVRRIDGVHEVVLPLAPGTPRAHVVLSFHGPYESTPASRDELSAMGEVLQSGLRQVLREERGGTYGVGVDTRTTEIPTGTYTVDIDFQCDPDRVDELVEAMWAVIERVRTRSAAAQGIAVMQEQRRRDRQTEQASNGWWVSELAGSLQRGEDPHQILDFETRNQGLVGWKLQSLASKLLTKERYVLVVQRPQ